MWGTSNQEQAMSAGHHRGWIIITGLFGGLALLLILFKAPDTRVQAQPTTASAKVAELHKQRIDTLREGVEVARQSFSQGLSTAEEVNRTERALLEAELQAAASPQQRVKLLHDGLVNARKFEELTAKQ